MVEYMNSKFKCIVCGKRPKRKDSNILVNGKPVKLTVPAAQTRGPQADSGDIDRSERPDGQACRALP